MTFSASTSYRHHGKRIRVAFSTEDESRAGADAVFAALDDELRARRKAKAAKVVRQAFRKKKARKDP